MHYSALATGKNFFETYAINYDLASIVEIGSQDVNGSLRDVVTPNVKEYIGLDFVEGKGVDVVLENPYKYPFENNRFDILVTSSCFEHSEMFWLSFLEGMRILKEDGVMYINVPSAWMMYHRYPVDCWRFWPDAGKGLETWALYNNLNSQVLESYITPPGPGEYVADFVCVFIKNREFLNKHPFRMIDVYEPYKHFFNGFRFPETSKFSDGWKTPVAELKQDVLEIKENKIYLR